MVVMTADLRVGLMADSKAAQKVGMKVDSRADWTVVMTAGLRAVLKVG